LPAASRIDRTEHAVDAPLDRAREHHAKAAPAHAFAAAVAHVAAAPAHARTVAVTPAHARTVVVAFAHAEAALAGAAPVGIIFLVVAPAALPAWTVRALSRTLAEGGPDDHRADDAAAEQQSRGIEKATHPALGLRCGHGDELINAHGRLLSAIARHETCAANPAFPRTAQMKSW
jgi:hypothetical protein